MIGGELIWARWIWHERRRADIYVLSGIVKKLASFSEKRRKKMIKGTPRGSWGGRRTQRFGRSASSAPSAG